MCNRTIYNSALIVKCQLFGKSIYKITFTGENERFQKKRKWKVGDTGQKQQRIAFPSFLGFLNIWNR